MMMTMNDFHEPFFIKELNSTFLSLIQRTPSQIVLKHSDQWDCRRLSSKVLANKMKWVFPCKTNILSFVLIDNELMNSRKKAEEKGAIVKLT